jgi:hypothetical protein
MDSVWSKFYPLSFREMLGKNIQVPDEPGQTPAVTRMEEAAT